MTNYEKYFGTPEKAAQTIDRMIYKDECLIDACFMFDNCSGCPCNGMDEFTEWLRSEVQSDE